MIVRESVIANLKKVPRGKVVSYGELASASGTSARAVGRIMSSNERRDVLCYKVVRSNGELGEYSGTGSKEEKIRKEGIPIINAKIDMKRHGWKFN